MICFEPGGPVEIAVGALSGIRIITVFAGSFGPTGQSFALEIVIPRGPARNRSLPACSVAPSIAQICGQSFERELGLVALTQQHSQRAIAVATAARPLGKSAVEQCQRALLLSL